MKWKDTNDDVDTAVEEENPFEEDYSPLRKRKLDMGSRLTSVFTRSTAWLVLIPVLVVVFLIFFMRPGGSDKAISSAFDQRFQQLETRVGSLEGIRDVVTDLDKNRQAVQPLMIRLDRLETSFANRISEMEKALKKLQTQTVNTVSKQDQTSSAKRRTPKQAAKTHVVKKGETLYSISKQYGLSLTQLMSINQLSKGAVINPGQKLKVSP